VPPRTAGVRVYLPGYVLVAHLAHLFEIQILLD
jgi:hypothetical protein